MAHVLRMAIIQSIQQLHAAGWSQRRIARELEIDRGTVARYVQTLRADPNAAILPAGSAASNAATFSPFPGPGDQAADGAGRADPAAARAEANTAILPAGFESKTAIPPAGSNEEPPADGRGHADAAGEPTAVVYPPSVRSPAVVRGRPHQCEAYRELIAAKLATRLSAQRIWQDLAAEQGFRGSYDSVKRFVRKLAAAAPLPFRRMECGPGEEAQVDFGAGAMIVMADGRRRKTHVFRIVLSHSRKAYSEATYTQTVEDFFRALENAFAHFGGVPKTLVIDNLKAAVARPDWFDPVLTPKVQAFCQHYGTVILPTKPYTPRHKGKIESGVKYVKRNALAARTFSTLEEQNRHLAEWERSIADTRIHGTTKRQVREVFERSERAALLPLSRERFPSFHEGQRKVNRDGHVEVAKAYYSVPPEQLGRTVWVRWDARLVRIFDQRFEAIAVHVRHEQGRFSTHAAHIPKEKTSGLEKGAAYLLEKVGRVGPETKSWAEAMLVARGIEGTRVLQGVLALTKQHRAAALESACKTALSHNCWRLRSLRELLKRQAPEQTPLPFLDAHPIIRPLSDYGAVVARAIQRQAERQPAADAAVEPRGERDLLVAGAIDHAASSTNEGLSTNEARAERSTVNVGAAGSRSTDPAPQVSVSLDAR